MELRLVMMCGWDGGLMAQCEVLFGGHGDKKNIPK